MLLRKQNPSDLFTIKLLLGLFNNIISIYYSRKNRSKDDENEILKILFPSVEIKLIYLVILNSYDSDSEFHFS